MMPARGEVRVWGPVEVPGFEARHLRLYLPPGASHASQRPVLYLFDGQNVFDDAPSFAGGWRVHESLDRLSKGKLQLPIVVGIDNGGGARMEELSPWKVQNGTGRADAFIDWVVGGLMPIIERELPVLKGPEHTLIGGASMGGLAALYGHLRHPAQFGKVLCMSPSFWVDGGRIFEWVGQQPKPWRTRVYLDCGALEGGGRMMPLALRMVEQLSHQGWHSSELMWRPDARGNHTERHWRRRFPKAIRFLLSA